MKVKAKTNIKYGDNWLQAGEEFDVKESDLPELEDLVEAAEKPARAERNKAEEVPEAKAEDAAEAKSAGRRAKKAE